MCFKVSNVSNFDLGENILSTVGYIIFMMREFVLSSLNIIISKKKKKNSKSKLTLCLSWSPLPPNLAPDQISVNMRLLSPVFVFNENIIDLDRGNSLFMSLLIVSFVTFSFYENFRSFIILK